MSGATTSAEPLQSFRPPLRLQYKYFTTDDGKPRAIAQMPGKGPTWLSGFASLPDRNGDHRLVASYVKINPPLEAYESGLCVWDDAKRQFKHLRTMWEKSKSDSTQPELPSGHVAYHDGGKGRVALFGNPLPRLRCAATFEAWSDPTQWETLHPQDKLESAKPQADIEPHSGSIAWNEYRQRWITVFMQKFGDPSPFGEIWYAEAESPYGPWGPAVKVLSHANYSFYNPRIHPELTPTDSSFILFEGTYTAGFANNPSKTPRYDYNQVLYRIDFDHPELQSALVHDKDHP